MPIDEQVSALDKLIEKVFQEDRDRRINQRIIPRNIEEAIENLMRTRIVRSRFKALLLLAAPAARDLNQAVNDQVNNLVKTKVAQALTTNEEEPVAPRKRRRKKAARH